LSGAGLRFTASGHREQTTQQPGQLEAGEQREHGSWRVVAIAQFEAFVEAGACTEPGGLCGRGSVRLGKQRYNGGAGLQTPLGSQLSLAQPDVGKHQAQVTWYEADAFARWLEHLRGDGSLLPSTVPDAHVIRLPHEAKREWAARYSDWARSHGEIAIAMAPPLSTKRRTATRRRWAGR
jgi:formylglycine-generating enzyme required for sulfatase activity